MGYAYSKERPKLFTDEGQRMFLAIRDEAKRLLKVAGAFRLDAVLGAASGDTWLMLACVDRMVELGELRELTAQGKVAGQYRVFVET